jgi:hypothetical protein
MNSNAGPDMDSQVARKLFGTVVIIDTQTGNNYMMGKDREPLPVPPFSTDMETAEEVTDLLTNHGFTLSMKKAKNGDDNCWYACFSKEDGRRYVSSMAATPAEVVCVAALAALTGDNIYKGIKVV